MARTHTLDKYRNIGIMATLMPAKPQLQKEFYIILERVIKLEKFMMVQQQWIGWNKSKKEELQ